MTVIVSIVCGFFGGLLALAYTDGRENRRTQRIVERMTPPTYTWVSQPIESDWFRTRDA